MSRDGFFLSRILSLSLSLSPTLSRSLVLFLANSHSLILFLANSCFIINQCGNERSGFNHGLQTVVKDPRKSQ